MSGVRQVVASVRGATVSVAARPEALAGLARVARPYIDWAPAAGPPRAPHVRVGDGPPDGADWRRVVLRSEYEPDRVLWVDDARHRLTLPADDPEWTLQQLLRSVRHLLRWQGFARGDLFLHGGLVRVAGRGVAFLGHKKSGKTSSILSALLNGGADFVSNDDLVLTDTDTDPDSGAGAAGGPLRAGAPLTGYGSPRTVNIRTDALLELAGTAPGLRTLLAEASHPTNAFPGRHHTRDAVHAESGTRLPGSVWVRCAELAHVTGRNLLPDAPVHAVVLPRFDAGTTRPDLTRLTPAEAHRALAAHVEETATKYDPFLAAWYPRTDADRRARLLRRLAEETPCYRLTQSMTRLADGTSAVLAAVRDAR
ncbi:hypothetical protein RM844_20405 [Streptomyces sp. DSM 44915]|uniref:Uncharacterized protein n=1 Tax=Streptomyces chisholmiae TaxID=3075540 RepID=A0ABU2JUH6_9ACTN|nr:hypothetical protein [Streptomyces sp. DSM 44915]MDT0268651.1 hypothetical protein [Streptomyces sp. DSM 44915]